VSLTSTRRLGGLAIATALFVAACGGAGVTGNPTQDPGGSDGSAMDGPRPPTATITLQGAGATFPAPLYLVWFEDYSAAFPNVRLDYQAIGSGGGIKAITEQTVDFGASDAPMKDEEVAALPAGGDVLHVPTALGAVVVIYNLPSVPELKLDSDALVDIFLGNITSWDDSAIVALNPGASLPSTPVTVVHRSDGSGTTNAFTTYLDTVSSDWNSQVGKGKEVDWPTGLGAQGNDGVAAGVKQTEGAVGYVELNYAQQANLTSAFIRNADGNFVAGSTEGVTAAGEAAAPQFPADFRQAPIINGAGPTTYPIASYTYLLIPVEWNDADQAQAMVAFTYWALTDGQSRENTLGYAPLPGPIREASLAELHRIKANGTVVWP
jgi:phosphate transport system substrate-binding protein